MQLRNAINAAATENSPTLNHEVQIKTGSELHAVSFSIRQMPGQNKEQRLLLVSFQDVQCVASGKRGKAIVDAEMTRIEELERELAYTKENLQATIEEQQASNEELKSTNEELQSTNEELQSTNEELQSANEELQSTNEELETSKEELQSVNEELVTVNAELQAKIEQLAAMQNDMKNLLDNINVGTLFLDRQLRIKRITRDAVKIYRLVNSDVGRPLSDIKSNIEDVDLINDARIVLDTLIPFEREVHTKDACYLARIQPYRTLDNVIDGVVLTFTDINARVAAEAAVNEQRELFESIVNTVREPLIVLDGDLRVITASRAFYRYSQTDEQNTLGRLIFHLGNKQWDIPILRELLENILPKNQVLENFSMEHDFPLIGPKKLLLDARRIVTGEGSRPLIMLAMEEIA